MTPLERFKDGGYWPFLIVGLLAGGVIMNISMVMTAADDPGFAIEEDYYRKAVDWDKSREQVRKNRELGWTLKVDSSFTDDGLAVEARLSDRLGGAISDASVQLQALHVARANQKIVAMMDYNDGRFHTRLDAHRPGAWEFKFLIKRGDEIFTHTERADVMKAEGAL
ncbi:MAG: FixH family protein [Myxococcota bacterium]